MTRTARGAGLLLAAVLCACVPDTVERAQPPGGPGLAVEVSNVDRAARRIGFSFASDGSSGIGEALVVACTRSTLIVEHVAGLVSITVDGEAAFASEVPSDRPADGFLVIRVTIDTGGDVQVDAEFGRMRRLGTVADVPLAGCA